MNGVVSTIGIYLMHNGRALMNLIGVAIALICLVIAILEYAKEPQISARLIILIILSCLAFGLTVLDLKNQETEKSASAYEGVLQPDRSLLSPVTDILFSTKDGKYPALELGDSGAIFNWAGPNGKPMLVFNDTDLTISKIKGQLKISATIRGQDGLVAEIVNNEWKINPQESFDRNYNKNALEVRDKNGDIVLQVRLLNDRIQFQGIFYDKNGDGIAIGGSKDMGGGIMEITGAKHPNLEYKIEPIFKYPSGLHLGETI